MASTTSGIISPTDSNAGILQTIMAMFQPRSQTTGQPGSTYATGYANGYTPALAQAPASNNSNMQLAGDAGSGFFFVNAAGMPLGKDGQPIKDFATINNIGDFSKLNNDLLLNPSDVLAQLKKAFGGGGDSSSATTATTPDLSKSLSKASPNQGSTVNGGQSAYTNPASAQAPGMGATLDAPAQMPMMPSAPVAQGSLPPLTTVPPLKGTPTGPATMTGAGAGTVNHSFRMPGSPPPSAPTASSLAAQVQAGTANPSDITNAGGPLQASTGPGPLPSAPVQSFQPMTTSSDFGGPTNVAPAPNQIAGLRNYTSTPLTSGVVGTGGQGYLPQSMYTNPTVGPNVVNAPGGGYTTAPNSVATNIGTWSPAAGQAGNPDPDPSAGTIGNYAAGGDMASGAGGGITGAQAGSAAAGLISAIGSALKPQFIPNTIGAGSSVLPQGLLGKLSQFRPATVQGQPMR